MRVPCQEGAGSREPGPGALACVEPQPQPRPALSLHLTERALPFQALGLLDSFLPCKISIAHFTDKETGLRELDVTCPKPHS